MEVGDSVRVSSHHWLRPNAVGVISAFDGKRGEAHWQVEFPPEVGRGFDGGRFLWLSDSQLVAVDAAKCKPQ